VYAGEGEGAFQGGREATREGGRPPRRAREGESWGGVDTGG
jgi:hypothetical protein